MEPEFKLFGDTEILKEMKINIQSVREDASPYKQLKIETLLYKGNQFEIQNENVLTYNVYFSYRDSIVGKLEFENVMQWANDHINHIYIKKDKNNKIYILYIGRKDEIETENGFKSNFAISLNEFFEIEKVSTDKKNIYRNYFFDFYNPKEQRYTRFSLNL